MKISTLPLLDVQRKLLNEPRGWGRFETYLKTMVGMDGELMLPLAPFNPMSKTHVISLLDHMTASRMEEFAEERAQVCAKRLTGVPCLNTLPHYQLGLVIADDAQGGWTNRYLFDAKHRFEQSYGPRKGFITVLFWSSEGPTKELVERETAAAIFRTAWTRVVGLPRTLGEMMRQEGLAARFAGHEVTQALPDSLCRIVEEYRASISYPEIIACLYGDDAAATLGYDPIGMQENGVLEVVASKLLSGVEDPVRALTANC